MNAMPKLSLIIPCYNEENTLDACVAALLKLPGDTLELEIIIVDDCSTDSSKEKAYALASRHACVKVFAHTRNLGKGAALQTGFLRATGDFVGIQDADAEYDPQDYLKMLAPLLTGKADVVYGSRYLQPNTRRVLYFWHTLMNKFLTFFSNMFTDLGITDMETCYKLFRRDIIESIAPQLREKRFGFEPEVTALVAEKGCVVYECAIAYNPRTYAEGKKIGWKDGIWAMYCIMHYGAHRAPLPMQLMIYFFIGTLCALANISLFSLFMRHMSLPPAAILAFALAAALNYLLCICILFKHKARWNTRGELTAYIFCILVMGCVDYLCTAFLVGAGLSPLWAKTTATILGFFGNFILRRYTVF